MTPFDIFLAMIFFYLLRYYLDDDYKAKGRKLYHVITDSVITTLLIYVINLIIDYIF